MKERDLWQVVARHLRKRYGWSKYWWAGSGKPFGNLRAGMGQGQPDVVGVSEKRATPEIHFVEGKILRPSRNKFNETISQLRDWRSYANYLWAAFARADWELVSEAQREQWETNLRYEGIGLVLVKDGKATIPLESRSNSQVETEKQLQVLERLGSKRAKLPVPFFSLGRNDALAAAGAIAWCYDIFDIEAREVARTSKKYFSDDYEIKRQAFFCWDGWYDKQEQRAITGDPLGSMAGNGIPGILVWKRYRRWEDLPTNGSRSGAFLYASYNDDDMKVILYSDVDAQQFTRTGLKDLWLFWQVPIEGRSRQGIKRSIREVWDSI